MDFNLFSKMLAMDQHTPRGAARLMSICTHRGPVADILGWGAPDVGHLFTQMDKDEDGRISQKEFV